MCAFNFVSTWDYIHLLQKFHGPYSLRDFPRYRAQAATMRVAAHSLRGCAQHGGPPAVGEGDPAAPVGAAEAERDLPGLLREVQGYISATYLLVSVQLLNHQRT